MTQTDVAIAACCIVAVIGLIFLALNKRGDGEVSGLGVSVKGGVGLVLLVLGLGGAGYVFYHPIEPDRCLFMCPPPPPPPTPPAKLSPKVFEFPDIVTRQGDGKSGQLNQPKVTLLPPDDTHPNGQFIATWNYATGSGTWKGSQHVTIRMKGEGGADLPSPKAVSLDRSKCHYGAGDPQTVQGDLQTPFDTITGVEIIPDIASGPGGTPC